MAGRRSDGREADFEYYTVLETSGNTNVPAFLLKLWRLVEDPSNNDIICWDTRGKSFHIYDQSRFAQEVLPFYFKHNNISSFIRQLNMYGFRKVLKVEQGGLKVEHDDLEFQHAYFQRGEEQLLELIKRRSAQLKTDARQAVNLNTEEVSKVLTDVTQIKGKQESIAANMGKLQRENEALWREVAVLRQKHAKQQQIVSKLLQFLLSLVNTRGRGMAGLSRKRPLMINNAPQLSDTSEISPTKKPNIPCLDSSRDHDYTVESPASDVQNAASNAANSSVIIQELAEPTVPSNLNLPVSGNVSSPAVRTAATAAAPAPPAPSNLSFADLLSPISANAHVLEQALLAANSKPQVSPQKPQSQQHPQQQQQQQTGKQKVKQESKEIALRSTSDQPLSAAATSLPNTKDVTEQLELVQSDLDNLRDALSSGQFSLDSSFISGLFDSPSTFQINLDQSVNPDAFPISIDQSFLDSLSADSQDAEQSTSTAPLSTVGSGPDANNITGQELWQYQPQDSLPDLFESLDDEKPQASSFLYDQDDSKSPGLQTPVNPVSFDDAGFDITAEELD